MQDRCRVSMEHFRQPRPDSGLDFQVKGLQTFQVVPSSLASGSQLGLKQTSSVHFPLKNLHENYYKIGAFVL